MIMYHKQVNLSPVLEFSLLKWVKGSFNFSELWAWNKLLGRDWSVHWQNGRRIGEIGLQINNIMKLTNPVIHMWGQIYTLPVTWPLYFFKKIAFLELDIYNFNSVLCNKNILTITKYIFWEKWLGVGIVGKRG